MDLEYRLVNRRGFLRTGGLALAALVSGVFTPSGIGSSHLYAEEEETQAKPDRAYTLLLSRDLSDRSHAIELIFGQTRVDPHEAQPSYVKQGTPLTEEQAKKLEALSKKAALDQIACLEQLIAEQGLDLRKDYFESANDFNEFFNGKKDLKEYIAAQKNAINAINRKDYTWAEEFNPLLWREELVASVDNVLSKTLQILEIKNAAGQHAFKVPKGMAWIPAGRFVEGSMRREAQYFEQQTDSVIRQELKGNFPGTTSPREYSSLGYIAEVDRTDSLVPKSFLIAKTEMTNGQYAKLMAKMKTRHERGTFWQNSNLMQYQWKDGLTPPPGKEDFPVLMVDYATAKVASEFMKGRVPSARELQFAGRGFSGRIWADGNKRHMAGAAYRETAESRGEFLANVYSPTRDVSPFGVRDTSSNAPEWTSTIFRSPLTPSWDTHDTETRAKEHPTLQILVKPAWAGSFGKSEYRLARGAPLDPSIADKTSFRYAIDLPLGVQFLQIKK